MKITAFTKTTTLLILLSLLTACGGSNGGGATPSDNLSNLGLSNLELSEGTIDPAFQSNILDYTLTVGTMIASATVTPTTTDANATVTVNGVAVTSGSASAAIALAVGESPITIVVTLAGGGSSQTYTVNVIRPLTSFELLDPTPGAGDLFGDKIILLGNGNIVVTDPSDSSVAAKNGAVHLYNPITQTLIASIYGDVADDQLGSTSITALANNNFVIASPLDNEGGIAGAGSVRLVDGTTGLQIGATLAGDDVGDLLGFAGNGSDSIFPLANNNFVIASAQDDEGGIVDAGSVRLVNGSTGAQIGATLAGDVADDQLGFVPSLFGFGRNGIITLANSNFVIVTPRDNEGGITEAGSVRLVDGSTGAQIGATLAGDAAFDQLGSSSVTALPNSNFVIASSRDNGFAGSVILVNGSTGAQITTLVGEAVDQLGLTSVTALANNNFVIASASDNEGGIAGAGSVRLVNGSTGSQIGATLAGDVAGDKLGFISGSFGRKGVIALTNNNFVVASSDDNEGGIVEAGSVRLVNGSTGAQIGATLAGDVTGDQLGFSGLTALANNNFVIASERDNEGGIAGAGSIRLVNGSTGAQIGTTLAGDITDDQLGSRSITALANNNFVIVSYLDDEGGIVDAGSIRLVDGSTGAQIGATLAGDVAGDQLGLSFSASNSFSLNSGFNSVTALVNNNFVFASQFDDEGGIVDAGSVRAVDGTTGLQIGGTIAGSVANDVSGPHVIAPATGNFYIFSLKNADNNGVMDSGLVRLIAQ
ncbi:hypothetical protein MNBD_GAMMA06-1315 [hydrothermal vent metagenome]|uniref:Cadherin-like beta-sandwich-like domain-containing protein n=1 Tax=hydrothermal vent metagenome TaxID=652676 RepID=A0A3B0WT22_9ZZZZ